MKFLAKSLFSFALTSVLATQSYAACSIQTPGDCISNPGSIGSGEALGRYEVSVKNSCSKKLWVATHYKIIQDGSSSTLACDGCDPSWATAGYWSLEPGEQKFIAVTQNRIVYLHAHSDDGQTTWGSTDKQWKMNGTGELKPFFEVTMTNSYSRWTQNLSCN